MAGGINKVILIGNLGQDPEIRHMTNGTAFTNVTVATTESWRDKSSGEKKDLTEWHRVVFYRKLAEIAGEYLRKGAKVYVEGSLRTRKWQDKDGVDRYTTEIQANHLEMLDRQGTSKTAPKDASKDGLPADSSGYLPTEELVLDFDETIPF